MESIPFDSVQLDSALQRASLAHDNSRLSFSAILDFIVDKVQLYIISVDNLCKIKFFSKKAQTKQKKMIEIVELTQIISFQRHLIPI